MAKLFKVINISTYKEVGPLDEGKHWSIGDGGRLVIISPDGTWVKAPTGSVVELLNPNTKGE